MHQAGFVGCDHRQRLIDRLADHIRRRPARGAANIHKMLWIQHFRDLRVRQRNLAAGDVPRRAGDDVPTGILAGAGARLLRPRGAELESRDATAI